MVRCSSLFSQLVALFSWGQFYHLAKTHRLVAFLRWNLFIYRDLWDWIDDPFDIPPLVPGPVQYTLPMPGLGQHRGLATT
jgi:hypothetical protein